MTYLNTDRYIDILPQVVTAYNNSKHRTLQRTPQQVHEINDPGELRKIFHTIYRNRMNSYGKKHKIKVNDQLTVGQYVRIPTDQRIHPFSKGYIQQNTLEIFKIRHIDREGSKVPVFFLEDLGGEPIEGAFYREELVPTYLPEEGYRVSIIKSDRRSGKYFVHFDGWPVKFDRWVMQSDLDRWQREGRQLPTSLHS